MFGHSRFFVLRLQLVLSWFKPLLSPFAVCAHSAWFFVLSPCRSFLGFLSGWLAGSLAGLPPLAFVCVAALDRD